MKRQLLNVGVLLPFTLLSTFFTATTATADLGMNKSNNIYQEIPSTFYQQERIPGEGKEPNINSVTYDGLVVEELSDLLTPEDLATTLVGMGVEVVDVTYKGADIASGIFYGGENIVGFNNGILLTSGSVHNVVGPNTSDNISTDNHTVGDTDLDALSGYTTYDAAVLEIDFIPTTPIVYFRYTFVSDEYNEYVNTTYNDVFAFFSGDVNQDGTIDASDLALIDNDASNFVGGYVVTDLTGDNFVDGTDFAMADNNAANFVSVIQP